MGSPQSNRHLAVLALTAVTCAWPLATPRAFAADFQVNTYTASNQAYAAVARAGDGAFVVVWGSSGPDGNSDGIFGQRFDSSGARVGGEFLVNTYTTGAQQYPAIAMSPAGAFLVTWRGAYDQDGSSDGVFGRHFDSTGGPQATEFRVNEQTMFAQRSPAVAVDDQGDFVVVWESQEPGYASSSNIFARRYDSTGAPLSGELRVNTFTLLTQRYPAVAADADGDFVVTWDSRDQDGDSAGNYGVFARRYTSDGAAAGGEFQVNVYTAGGQFFSAVAAADSGGFVVAWQSYQDGSGSGVVGRRFDSMGAAIGGELQINAHTTGNQRKPDLAGASAGDFLVTWTDGARDGGLDGIFARRFASDGSPLTADFQVNAYTTNYQRTPDLALGDDGGFVVAWQSQEQDGFAFGVFASLAPALPLLDIDGDGAVSALSDGVLTLRDLFGFTGATLTTGAVGMDCVRCAAPAIETYFDDFGDQFDADGNHDLDPLTDGILVLRYLFGFRGNTLVIGAVGPMCSRCTPEQLEPHLESMVTLPPNPI